MTTNAQQFSADGFLLVHEPLPQELIARVAKRIDQLCAAPPGPDAPRKMDGIHVTEPVIHELVSHPAIGRLAAAITGTSMVQVFTTQTLVKSTGGARIANIGWHQDLQYWHRHLQGELFTAWVAISDVTSQSGPMRFVRGSHNWGLLDAGDFFNGDLDALRAKILAKHHAEWNEVAAVLAPGCMSFHHRLTVHGSGANFGAAPRRSVAIHLRTEKSGLAPGAKFGDVGWLNDFADHHACPVVYGSEAAKAGSLP